MSSPQPAGTPGQPESAAEAHPHNFDVQKELHQQIRNDPDYDDWDYGTEPLPHEAWNPHPATAEPPHGPPAAEAAG
ncbi:MAG: hypothetical protein VKN13_03635 [Cyanobacteriota bacterium]|nr:hypothetical protein [Cyanobacteriota bacterium]